MTDNHPGFKRILLKVSGEALGGDDGTGIDPGMLSYVCSQISSLVESGHEIAVVMGAGNFFRGIKGAADGMDRVTGDQMGMVATIINALALRDGLNRAGIKAIATSAILSGQVTELYTPQFGRKMLSIGKVVLCAGGTGNPFFTTDTAAALRALELNCDAMFKATMVDGVYDSDPKTNPDAVRFEKITYDEVLSRRLKVMDLTAITLAHDKDLPVVVFDLSEKGVMNKLATGDLERGTLITS